MDRRLAQWLTALYPLAWRSRFGKEFAAFLEERSSTIGTILDVIGSALRERVTCPGAFHVNTRQQSLVMMIWAYLAAVAAGVNFYFLVDDTPLANVMRHHAVLSALFGVVAKTSFLALIAVVGLALPITVRMLHIAATTRRWDAIGRVAVPFGAAAATVAWMAAAGFWSHLRWGGSWVPLPWDVGGDWIAPHNWPPLSVRWPLSAVTLTLLIAGLLGSAISVRQAIERTDLSRLRPLWLKVTTLSLAAFIVVMALGVTAWGIFAERYALADFHIRNGGFFVSTNIASWSASAILFVASAFMAVRGARLAIAVHEESAKSPRLY
jgi:hypothetical protein